LAGGFDAAGDLHPAGAVDLGERIRPIRPPQPVTPIAISAIAALLIATRS